MAELRRIPLPYLLRRVLDEPGRSGSLFDLPLRKLWTPTKDLDLSVAVHGHRAQTPVGPAAGPHAQLAQNIALAWLGGARVIELKTVQILDELKIPRPCIDAATIGFNVEWSQELRLEDSLVEYVAGWMLLRMLRHLAPSLLGWDPAAAAASHPVFELSVGYSLEGLQHPRMRKYLADVQDVGHVIDRLRGEIPVENRELRDLDYAPDMVSCVTLSTFHGCPPGEIEAIAKYLLREIGVDVIVKLNPTLLGFSEVSYLLHERMGYHDLRPRKAAFDGDLEWNDAIHLGRRLQAEAAKVGRRFGVKMTNTLVVENHKNFFKPEEMYLSGAPLHVLAMHCVERWRAAVGTSIPLSFSGGIDQHNFADAVACDLVPVTTCTDLLRPGGYGRLPKYLANLEEAMRDAGAATRDELILRRFGQGPEAVRDVFAELRERELPRARDAERAVDELEAACLAAVKGAGNLSATIAAHPLPFSVEDLSDKIVAQAGALNAHEVTARVTGDPRYAAGKNGKPPRKVGSSLVLLDCLSCDKCVPVCPNDANFAVPTALEEIAYEDLVLDESGAVSRVPGGVWAVRKPEQWANFADACNECGNCDVFCPEDGGPYVMKARFFGSHASMDEAPHLDGMLVEPQGGTLRVRARVAAQNYICTIAQTHIAVENDAFRARYDVRTGALESYEARPTATGARRLSGAVALTVRALVKGALDEKRMNPVSATGVRWPVS